jgi:flagellar biogenesis protein FliO
MREMRMRNTGLMIAALVLTAGTAWALQRLAPFITKPQSSLEISA